MILKVTLANWCFLTQFGDIWHVLSWCTRIGENTWPVTLNKLEGHSSFRAFQVQVIYICAAQQFTRFQLARPRRAVSQRQLGFLLWADISAKQSPVCPARWNVNWWTVILCTLFMANKFDLICDDISLALGRLTVPKRSMFSVIDIPRTRVVRCTYTQIYVLWWLLLSFISVRLVVKEM